MKTLQIVDLIRQLPLSDKLHLIELIFRDIKTETLKIANEAIKRTKAAELLLSDYQTDEELTIFTSY